MQNRCSKKGGKMVPKLPKMSQNGAKMAPKSLKKRAKKQCKNRWENDGPKISKNRPQERQGLRFPGGSPAAALRDQEIE